MSHGPVFQKLWNQLLGVRFGIRGNAFLGLASLLAVTLVYAAYAPSLSFGFFWDDYHVLRPVTSDEVGRVFLGNWDTTHIEPVFYRPLAASWYALRFAIFGVNASFQHGLSLIGMAVAAVLVGIFVRRETGSLRMGLIAVSLVRHPSGLCV